MKVVLCLAGGELHWKGRGGESEGEQHQSEGLHLPPPRQVPPPHPTQHTTIQYAVLLIHIPQIHRQG